MNNIYTLLSQAAQMFATPATYKRKATNETTELNITAFEAGTEQLNGQYPGAFASNVFTVDIEELKTANGAQFYPEDGDIIEMKTNETRQYYKVIKNAQTARAWDWLFNTPGIRLKFYAMTINEKRDGKQ